MNAEICKLSLAYRHQVDVEVIVLDRAGEGLEEQAGPLFLFSPPGIKHERALQPVPFHEPGRVVARRYRHTCAGHAVPRGDRAEPVAQQMLRPRKEPHELWICQDRPQYLQAGIELVVQARDHHGALCH